MKIIFSPRKNHYLKRVGFLLIAVALVAAMVSCDGTAPTYNLTMEVAPPEGGTATDETNTGPYEEDATVNIKAVANPCYRFVDWSATAGQFGNASNATTTFTMPAEDVTVTANFEPIPADHFKFYDVYWETAPVIEELVYLEDQFGAINATVYEAEYFGNPVEKDHGGATPIADENRHYTMYYLEYDEPPQSWRVTVKNQFQTNVELTVMGPFWLAVPTQKEDQEMSDCLDHLLVYEVIQTVGWLQEPMAVIGLHDQFFIEQEQEVQVWDAAYFANPVRKEHPGGTVAEIQRPDLHYVGYYLEAGSVEEKVQVSNQFDPGGEPQTLDLSYSEFLAVPSEKIAWEQPLDHFKGYWADWSEGPPPPGFPVEVQLDDQFVTINATVWEPYLFANPTDKWLDEGVGTPISDPRNHLTFYWIEYGEGPQLWTVEVTNQFGIDQLLLVGGPFWLAVPTQKSLHAWPENLDHFLVYEVLDFDYQYGEVGVYLWDQFTDGLALVDEPAYFANPVKKTDASGTTDIGDEHLLFYWITSGDFWIPDLPIANQFGPQYLEIYEGYLCECEWWGYDILGVPSEKTDWDPFEG